VIKGAPSRNAHLSDVDIGSRAGHIDVPEGSGVSPLVTCVRRALPSTCVRARLAPKCAELNSRVRGSRVPTLLFVGAQFGAIAKPRGSGGRFEKKSENKIISGRESDDISES
jgi:hypothetical protein